MAAFNYTIHVSGQAGEGSDEAVKAIRDAFRDLVTSLDDAGVVAGGQLTGKVEPQWDTANPGTLIDGVAIHDQASDVLAAARDEDEDESHPEEATEAKATKPATRKRTTAKKK